LGWVHRLQSWVPMTTSALLNARERIIYPTVFSC
jgi:hypothetical protein